METTSADSADASQAAAASGGPPQLPDLLAGYVARPAWQVAGVDYAVGVSAGTALKDPATLAMAGVSVDAADHTVYVTASGVTLDGYDFGLAGGYAVVINSGVTNTVIENSHFLVGANDQVPIQAGSGVGNLTVQNCTIDGGSRTDPAAYTLIEYNGTGDFVSQYNMFENAPADAIDFSAGRLTYAVDNNVFVNLGTNPGAHPDTVQNIADVATNSTFDFNTIYQPNGSGEQGIQLDSYGGSSITNSRVENNTVVAKGPSLTMSYDIAVGQTPGDNTTSGALISNNYIDASGAYGPFYPPSGSDLTFVDNVNLDTGTDFASPSGTSSSDVQGVSADPSSGTQTTGSMITLVMAMDQAAFVSGTPTLTLNDGGSASYVSGSGTSSLVFQTTVTTADHAVATLAITGVSLAGGASIVDEDGNALNLAGADASLSGLGVAVTAAPPAVAWSAASVKGTEGASISLGTLSETLNGEVAQSLVISGIPVGATLTDGSNRFTASAGATSVDVSGWNLGGLSVTPAEDGSFSLTATATASTPAGAPGGSATASESVTVGPAAPAVTWQPAAAGVAGKPTHLGTLAAEAEGLPGDVNTLQSLVVSGMPAGAVLTDGTHSFTAAAAGASVNLAGWSLANLQIDMPRAASFTLTATAIEQDAGGVTSTASATEPVAVAAFTPVDPYADGAAGAPAGTAQLPDLLSGDAVHPAWAVAGVNYAVGAPTGLALLDPTVAANLPAGASIDAADHLILVHGNNVTLNGFDFGLHGGWGVEIEPGTTGTTVISNSSFSMGASEPIAIDASGTNVGNLTILDDTFNGNQENIPSTQPPPNGTGLGSAVNYDGAGTFTAKYNYLFGLPADGFDLSDGTVTPTIEYNLFAGLGYTPGAHPDPIQFYADEVNNALIAFNTIYTPQGSNKAANEGLQIQAQGGSTITNTTVENNTIIATGPTMTQSLSIATWQYTGNTLNGVVVDDNYIDPTASYGAFGSGGNAPEGSGLSFVGNVDLLDGTAIASPQGTRSSDVTGVTASPSSGAEAVGSVIMLTLAMDQVEKVTGTPTLKLNDGGTASYVSGSGTKTLQFKYVVAAGDTPVTTLAVTGVDLPSGASIDDRAGSPQNLSGAAVSLPGLSIPAAASNTLVLNLSEDAYLGDAMFTLTVDGVQQGPAESVTALHSDGQDQTFSYTLGAGAHSVQVSFINDAYGGSASLDRNLYIDSVTYDGASVPGVASELYTTSSESFAVGTAAPPPAPPADDDTLVLNLSQDAYKGDAKFIAYVDGKALGPAQLVGTLHSAGDSEAFTFYGNFGAGPHTVEVDFINDAYGGSPILDRNLYVNSIEYDGTLYANDKATILTQSGYQFTVDGPSVTANTGVPVSSHS
jgi:hypothetical protein